MKNILLNLIGFAIISTAAVYAFYAVQTKSGAGGIAILTGQNHGSEVAAVTHAVIPPAERDPNRLWCREHGLYEDECVICHPEIAEKRKETAERDPNRLWCREHGLYEDECVICHSEISEKRKDTAKRDPNRLWCREHDLYEDECVICHPEIAEKNDHKDGAHNEDVTESDESHDQAGGHVETAEGLFCAEHRVLEVQCGVCQPQLAENLLPGEGMMVRLPSMMSVQMAGIQTGWAQQGALQNENAFLCEVVFDQSRIAHISPLANGVIQKVYVDFGDQVEAGQILFEIASTEIANAKSSYLKAVDQENLKRLTYQREKELKEKQIAAKQDFQLAEAEYQVAQTETMTSRQQLVNYGLEPVDIEAVRNSRSTTSLLKVRAPFSGTVIDKHVVLGESVTVGDSVIEIGDLSTMWVTLSLPEPHIASLEKGDTIQAEFPALPGVTVDGEITWVSPRLDENTRMLKARAEVKNTDGTLKQGLYGKARPVKQGNGPQWLVPQDSVQQIDGTPYIFVKQEDDLFEIRRVTPGQKSNQKIAIQNGLAAQDEIVIAGGFALKSEFLKSRFGAGCADH